MSSPRTKANPWSWCSSGHLKSYHKSSERILKFDSNLCGFLLHLLQTKCHSTKSIVTQHVRARMYL